MRVAFIQLGRIGDMVLTTPLFHEFKKLFPDSELHVFAGPSNYSILANNPDVDRVFVIDKSPLGIIKTLVNLRLNKYDYWIDPKDHLSNESRIVAKIVRATHKIGFNAYGLPPVFDIPIPENEGDMHHVEICLSTLNHFSYSMPQKIPKPRLFANHESVAYYNETIGKRDLKYMLFNISGSSEHKMWHDEYWADFFINVKPGLRKVICFAPSEKRRAETLASKVGNFEIFYSKSIGDIVTLVNNSEYVVSPDTAIVHMAAAFNKPVFALYSGLDDFYTKFHPLSDIYTVVRASSGDKGIKSIKPEDVASKYEEFLEQIRNAAN